MTTRTALHAPTRSIGDVMSASPHTITSDQKLSVAHRMMREHELRHLPVLRNGKLVGVLSQRDLYLVESMAGVDADIDVIADAMTPDVYATPPDTSLREVVHTMSKRKYGCAVILEGDRVTGVFTATDALRELADALP